MTAAAVTTEQSRTVHLESVWPLLVEAAIMELLLEVQVGQGARLNNQTSDCVTQLRLESVSACSGVRSVTSFRCT